MRLTLTYDKTVAGEPVTETVEAVQINEAGRAALASHADFIPLAPGDVVAYDDEEIVGLLSVAPVWTFEVTFPMPPDTITGMRPTDLHPAMRAIASILAGWKKQGIAVTRHTNFTAKLTGTDFGVLWAAAHHQLVEHFEQIRDPNTRIALDVARRHPDLGDGGGPWA